MDLKTDGVGALRAEIGVKEIASLIERTARWVDPATFELLPVWYPEHRRGLPFFNSNWAEPRMNKKRATGVSSPKLEGNIYAASALTQALGLRSKERPNWSCCHIWRIDDEKFQSSNVIVRDRRIYSCVANMVLLPTPLKAFTDAMSDVKAMLRLWARNLYGWLCDHEAVLGQHAVLEKFSDWDDYPASWPRASGDGKKPLGMVTCTPEIKRLAEKRLVEIRRDLQHAGVNYPREAVREVLAYWHIAP